MVEVARARFNVRISSKSRVLDSALGADDVGTRSFSVDLVGM
jgi:hypothetical protein